MIEILIFAIIIVFAIELFWLLKKNGKIKAHTDLLFNWTIPGERPFSLLILPLIILFFIHWTLISGTNAVLVLAVLAITTQVLVEEIFFRGMLFGALLKKFHDEKKLAPVKFTALLIIQAIIFTAIHTESINHIGVFLSAIIFGLAFYFSGKNILPPTLLHLAGNLLIYQNQVIIFISK